MCVPAHLLQMGTPPVRAIFEAKVVELVTNTFGKFKEKIVSAMHPQVQEVFAVSPQGQS